MNTDIAHQRLSNQRIDGEKFKKPEEVVTWMGAIQAQDYLQSLWAIGLRMQSATVADIEQAIADRKILRTWPLRGTLHFVPPEDAQWMLELSAARILALDKRRLEQLELDETIIERSQQLFYDALKGGRRLSRPEMMKLLEDAGISTRGQRGYHLLWYMAQTGLICLGPIEDKQQTEVKRKYVSQRATTACPESQHAHTKEQSTHMSIQPFKIAIPQSTLDDLRERLARTRWIDEVKVSGWTYGVDLGYMKELADYWQHTYDWRTHEAALNTFAQFKADVDGVGIHFIHERGKGPNPTPLLLIHGFPDSFYRYHKVIERLTDPAKYGGDPNISFDVIVPSIPGTGFSDRVTMDDDVNTDLFAKLMTQVLGYQHFVSAGGDHGAIITQSLARRYPEILIGIHLTDVGYPDQTTDFSTLSPAEIEMAQWVQKWFMEEGIGVNMIMATKPQTLAYGLNDSPVGLASWIIGYSSSGQKGKEEFHTRFSADEVLTNVTIYWVTATIHSAVQAYYANAHIASGGNLEKSVSVPAAVAHCPYDPPLPREWAARQVNLVHFTDFPRGGHFMAWEEPELYARDLQDFLSELRK